MNDLPIPAVSLDALLLIEEYGKPAVYLEEEKRLYVQTGGVTVTPSGTGYLHLDLLVDQLERYVVGLTIAGADLLLPNAEQERSTLTLLERSLVSDLDWMREFKESVPENFLEPYDLAREFVDAHPETREFVIG